MLPQPVESTPLSKEKRAQMRAEVWPSRKPELRALKTAVVEKVARYLVLSSIRSDNNRGLNRRLHRRRLHRRWQQLAQVNDVHQSLRFHAQGLRQRVPRNWKARFLWISACRCAEQKGALRMPERTTTMDKLSRHSCSSSRWLCRGRNILIRRSCSQACEHQHLPP